MARLNLNTPSSDVEENTTPRSSPSSRQPTAETPPSPAISTSSDKENRHRAEAARGGKRKSDSLASQRASMDNASSSSKRRRTDGASRTSQTAHRKELEERIDKEFYDPDQNEAERRNVKKGLRSLYSRLNDSRTEYLSGTSRGLEKTLDEADELFKSVKQTSDATIDSRLLVTTADLSYRKINSLVLGDSSTGVDVDDFITKCISFMRARDDGGANEGANEVSSTQRRRRRQQLDDEDAEAGDTMDWAYLGRNACFLYNSRPCVSGFLLGPLSVQKKVRQPTQRRAREARGDPSQAARPIELDQADLEKKESANLVEVCREIKLLLTRTQESNQNSFREEYEGAVDDPSPEEMRQMLRRHKFADNGCIPLFDFCVNPKSFGQTVENMFYVSFLIKEGEVGLDFDSEGLPTLGYAGKKPLEQRHETQRNQAVFTLDFDIWKKIIDAFGIEKSVIPHRVEERYDDGTSNYAENATRGQEDEVDFQEIV